jgi:hypothetical protein
LRPPARLRLRRQRRRLHARGLHAAALPALSSISWSAVCTSASSGRRCKHRFVFQNRRRKLPHLRVSLAMRFEIRDDIHLAAQLGVGLLENFQRLAVVRLRLHNDLEHLNRLLQLSFFAGFNVAIVMAIKWKIFRQPNPATSRQLKHRFRHQSNPN